VPSKPRSPPANIDSITTRRAFQNSNGFSIASAANFRVEIFRAGSKLPRQMTERYGVSYGFKMRRTRSEQYLVRCWAESRFGAVSVGRTYPFPPLPSGGALVVRPWLRFRDGRYEARPPRPQCAPSLRTDRCLGVERGRAPHPQLRW